MTQAFNLSQFANKVNTSGQASLTTAVTGTLPVANGGTGQSTFINGELLIGNTTGNTLTKATLTAGTNISITNGTGAITIASTASGGFSNLVTFTSSGTFTVPASVTNCKVTVVGGGGSGSTGPAGQFGISTPGGGGGGGGCAIRTISGLTPLSTISVTIGGTNGTSSFGAFASASGGSNSVSGSAVGGAGGIGTAGTNIVAIQGSSGGGAAGGGGSSFMGGGGAYNNSGGNYGGGGGGFSNQGPTPGASGIVIVEY